MGIPQPLRVQIPVTVVSITLFHGCIPRPKPSPFEQFCGLALPSYTPTEICCKNTERLQRKAVARLHDPTDEKTGSECLIKGWHKT